MNNEAETIEMGPFTWTKRTLDFARHSEEDVWALTHINGVKCYDLCVVGLTCFALKNYGGEPGSGFKGWKLVSGGPFDAAGAYSDLHSAIHGVTPFLVEYYTRIAATKQREANTILKQLADFQPKLSLQDNSPTRTDLSWSPCG